MITCRVASTALSVVAAALFSICYAQSALTPAPPDGNVPPSTTAPSPSPAQVTSHGNQIEVKVPDQAPLSAVMTALCQQQKLKCSGMDTLASYHGPAMSVEGTLRQVISKLVEGTDINYEFSRSAEGGATAIAFLGHAPKGTAPVPVAEQPAPPPPARALHSRPFPGKFPSQPPAEQAPNPQPQAAQPQPQAALEPETEPFTPDPEQLVRSEEAARILFSGSGNPDSEVLPFPDPQGNPIPKTDSAPTTLPFPDQNGNAIPVKPTKQGSPIPMKPSGGSDR